MTAYFLDFQYSKVDSQVLWHIYYDLMNTVVGSGFFVSESFDPRCVRHFETCVFMWYLVLLPTFVTYTSHPVQASLSPSLNCEYSKFPVATTLSKHLFSIKPVTNIKEYCEQINLNLPKRGRRWSQRNRVESLTDCCIDVPTLYRLLLSDNPSRLSVLQHDGHGQKSLVVMCPVFGLGKPYGDIMNSWFAGDLSCISFMIFH